MELPCGFKVDVKMQLETILQAMMKDHDKIVKLLNDFGKYIEFDKQTLNKAFEIFRWELEKHLFTEEKVIFTPYETEDYVVDYEIIPRLMEEHDKIYNQLKEMKKSIKFDKKCNFQEFKEIFLSHKDFEEEQVYPKFDEKLNESTKEMILKRIKEMKVEESGLKNIKVKCSECGKKLGIFEGYFYPKFEKRWIFCSKCWDKLEEIRLLNKKRLLGMGKWECTVCNYIYTPEKGDPKSGLAPGTRFEGILDDWVCPVCGVGKDKFEKL